MTAPTLLAAQAEVLAGNIQELRLEYADHNVSFFFAPDQPIVSREKWRSFEHPISFAEEVTPLQAWQELTLEVARLSSAVLERSEAAE